MQNSSKKTFGRLLLEAGMVTEEQLAEAVSEQQKTGKKMGEVLKEKGYITQEDIIQVLEFQLGVPHLNLERFDIDADAVKKIPENMARRHKLIPIKIAEGNKLVVAMENPLDIFAVDDVKLFSGYEVVPNIAFLEDIEKAIGKYYSSQEAVKVAEMYKQENKLVGRIEEENVEELVNSAPIVKLVNGIFEQAIKYRASDIHIEALEKVIKVRFRIDGQLKEMMKYDIDLHPAIVTRIKITGNMDIAEKRIPQDGRMSMNVEGNAYDLRLSVLPTIYGEKTVVRITSKTSFVKDKAQLGFYGDDLEKFSNILQNPHGIILVTGPTGSGKSTTLYAAVKDLNKEDVNIITVEDPVESKIDGINQVQVNVKAGLNFANALRSILRQDPDIIMIGEIRDGETANIAISAAITGHLVLSTLHTNDSASSISRLVDMGVEPFLIGSSLVGIVAQRLVRKICPKCVEEYTLTKEEIEVITNEIPDIDLKGLKVSKGAGCAYCSHTGYRGRLGVYEILTITPKIRQLINSRANADVIKNEAVKEGMKTLKANSLRLVLDGQTTISEMLRVAYSNE